MKKRTARRSTNTNCLVPNEGGSGPAGGVVVFKSGAFDELAMELILLAFVNFGAVRELS
jgi:hypothetical protein